MGLGPTEAARHTSFPGPRGPEEGRRAGSPQLVWGLGLRRVRAISGGDPRWMERPALAPGQLLQAQPPVASGGFPGEAPGENDSWLFPAHGPQGAPESRWARSPQAAAVQWPPSHPPGTRGSGRASPAHRRSGRLGPGPPGSLGLSLAPARPSPGLCRMGNFAADSSPIPTVGTAAARQSGPHTGKEFSLRKEAGLQQKPWPPAGLRTQTFSPCYQTPPQRAPTHHRSLPRHSEEVAAHCLLGGP